jgi:hypothetical protein
MIWTSRPRGVNERVVEILLNLVYDPLFKLGSAAREQANPRRRLFDRRMVAGSHGVRDVVPQQANHTRLIGIRNPAGLFHRLPAWLAAIAVRDAFAEGEMVRTEEAPAENAETNFIKRAEEPAALGAAWWSGIDVHRGASPITGAPSASSLAGAGRR